MSKPTQPGWYWVRMHTFGDKALDWEPAMFDAIDGWENQVLLVGSDAPKDAKRVHTWGPRIEEPSE